MRTSAAKPGGSELSDLCRSFLGLKCLGIFAPLSYFRGERDWGIGDLDTLSSVIRFASSSRLSVVQLLPLNFPVADNSPYAIASNYVLMS